jgi:hypothetical protein
MPFYMVMILLLYRIAGTAYPAWFSWIIGKTKREKIKPRFIT